ncbi:Transferase [Corchorus olitorius]|uniref:Transferase n=1 Tax=Corchorus olitorius TaxID=93759 RepID=A0A1R3KEW8_9ROSI|nr:Transferase [Corchorus olitorius]
MQGKDPVKVIREALAKALVFYYPYAGRLREGYNGKLMVDCTGEGILFIEADADVTLDEIGSDALQPPFPCFHELLYDVPGSDGISRLKCGGFILALRLNHVMSDGTGLAQFLSAVAEMARGCATPTILPVWERHILDANNPQRVTCKHNEYDKVEEDDEAVLSDNMVESSFFFGNDQMSSLYKLLPFHLRQCTKFELLTASLWRCRTFALNLNPNEEVRMICVVNVRSKFNPPLPSGYYGNAFVFPATKTTAGQLCGNPLEYAVELVKEAKASVTEEYVKSVASLLVINGKRLKFPMRGSYIISDVKHMGFRDLDFGWGMAEFGGLAKAMGLISFVISAKDKKGEVGALVPICLPAPAMERFAKELEKMLMHPTYESKFVVHNKGEFKCVE